jgi:hypothetical protein
MLKKSASFVLSRPSPCNVPQGYASVAELPAASLAGFLSILCGVTQLPQIDDCASSLGLWYGEDAHASDIVFPS